MRPTAIGQHLEALRRERGMSHDQVEATTAERISTPMLMLWEDGTAEPKPADLRVLAGVYGVSVVDLMVRAGHLHREEIEHYLRAA